MYNLETKKRFNSKNYSVVRSFNSEAEVIEYVKGNDLKFSIPYFFTHIQLSNGSIITQRDDNFGIICSPQKLTGMLQGQNLNA